MKVAEADYPFCYEVSDMSSLWYKGRSDVTITKLWMNVFTNDFDFTKSSKTDVLMAIWIRIMPGFVGPSWPSGQSHQLLPSLDHID